MTDEVQLAAAVDDATRALGPVDILVNNAGVPLEGTSRTPFIDSVPASWAGPLTLNVVGVLLCTHAVLRSMTERGWGRIITIVSEAGRVGEPGMAVYSAAKAGAAGFSRALAKEVGPAGVTSNAVSLGAIFRPQDWPDEGVLARAVKRYPMRRLGRPSDVATTVAWLAS